MALNQLGLGMTFSAENLASKAIEDVSSKFEMMEKSAHHAAETLHEAGESMEHTGLAMVAFAAGGLVLLGVATEKAHEFEQALKLVQTRTTEAQFPLEEMDALAGELAVKFGTLPIDQAKAMFIAVERGATEAAQAEQLLSSSNALAKATASDLGSTIGELSQVIKAYHLDIEKSSEDVSNALFAAAKAGGTTVGELSIMLEHFGPIAAGAGIGMDELLGSIAAVGKAGIVGRPAMAGMKAVIEGLIQPSKDAAMEAARLGIRFDATTLKAKGLPSVLRSIIDSGNFSSKSMERLFGSIQAGTVAMALMNDDGKQLSASIEAIAHSEGQVEAAAASLVTPGQRLEALKDQALILIGKGILPIKEAIEKLASKFLEFFVKIPKPLIAFGATLLLVGSTILFVGGAAAAATGAFIAMEIAIAPMLLGAAGAVAVLGALVGLLVLIGGPIAASLVGLKLAFDENLGGIRDTLVSLWDKTKLVYEGIAQLFEAGGLSGAVRTELSKVENSGLKNFVIQVFLWGKRIETFFSSLKLGFEVSIGRMGPIFEQLSGAFSRLGDALQSLFGGKNDPAANASKWVAFAAAGDRVGEVLSVVVEWVTKAATWLADMTTTVVAFVDKTGTIGELGETFSAVGQAIMSVVDSFGSFSDGVDDASSTSGGFGRQLGMIVTGGLELLSFGLRIVVTTLNAMAMAIKIAAGAWHVLHDAVLDILSPLTSAAKLMGFVSGPTTLPVGAASLPTSASSVTPTSPAASSPGRSVAATVIAAQLAASGGGAGGGSSEIAAAVHSGLAAKAPDNVTIHAPIHLDGEKIGEAMVRRQQSGGARAFAPQPLPSG